MDSWFSAVRMCSLPPDLAKKVQIILRTFAANRLLILPTTIIQCNGVCRLVLVNNL